MLINLDSHHSKNSVSKTEQHTALLFLRFAINICLLLLQMAVLMVISCLLTFAILAKLFNLQPNYCVAISSILFAVQVIAITIWRSPNKIFKVDKIIYSIFYWLVFAAAIIFILILTSLLLYAPLAVYDVLVNKAIYLPNNQLNLNHIWYTITNNLMNLGAWIIILCSLIYGCVIAGLIAFYKEWFN